MRAQILSNDNLFFWLIIIVLMWVGGCGKDNGLNGDQRCKIKAKIGQDDDIVGTWKLIKGQRMFHEPKPIDYSCDDVTYKFQEDGTLAVSSDTKSLIGLGPGQYPYQLSHEPLESANEEFTLQVDKLVMGAEVSADAMTINHSYLDGPILHFTRIR